MIVPPYTPVQLERVQNLDGCLIVLNDWS